MSRKDIEFQTSDGLTLRGWLYTPSSTTETKLPCLIMCHGWAAIKEMGLDKFAEAFVAKLPLAVLVYDHRSYGSSDTAPGQPQHEVIPALQMLDLQDAITYSQGLPNINAAKIALWGSSFSGGHVLNVAAVDKRVKAVISQAPMISGFETLSRLVRPDIMTTMDAMFEGDRLARAAGQKPAMVPVSDANPLMPSSLPSAEAFAFFSDWESKLGGKFKNEVTVRSLQLSRTADSLINIPRISPTPLLMVVAAYDTAVPADIALSAFEKALQPKKLVILKAGHFEVYGGDHFGPNTAAQIEFLRESFL